MHNNSCVYEFVQFFFVAQSENVTENPKQSLFFKQRFLMVGDHSHQRQSQSHPTSRSDHFLQSYVQIILTLLK